MPFVEEQPRRIETIEDVEAVLDSLRVSWFELGICIRTARKADRSDLVHRAAEQSVAVAMRHRYPHLKVPRIQEAVESVLRSFVDSPERLTDVAQRYSEARSWEEGFRPALTLAAGELGSRASELRRLINEVLLLIDDGSNNSMSRLSKRFRKLKRPDLAIEACSTTLSSDPEDITALTSRGAAHADRRHYEEAENDLLAALDLEPRSIHALTSLSRVLQEVGRLEEALESGLQAFRIAPDEYSAHRILKIASALQNWALFQEALEVAQRSLESTPDDPWIGVLAVRILLEDGHLDQAGELINELENRSPGIETSNQLDLLRRTLERRRFEQRTLFEESDTDDLSDSDGPEPL